jgi:hypothetical protein
MAAVQSRRGRIRREEACRGLGLRSRSISTQADAAVCNKAACADELPQEADRFSAVVRLSIWLLDLGD